MRRSLHYLRLGLAVAALAASPVMSIAAFAACWQGGMRLGALAFGLLGAMPGLLIGIPFVAPEKL